MISSVLAKYVHALKNEYNVVYSQNNTDIRSIITKIRSEENRSKSFHKDLPILVINRTPLVVEDRWGRNPHNKYYVYESATELYDLVKFVPGRIDVSLTYVSSNVSEVEDFELKFATRTGVIGDKKVVVDFGEPLGQFEYNVIHNELSEFVVSKDEFIYSYVSSSVIVSGVYFVLTSVTAPPIKKIVMNIYRDSAFLETITVE